MGVGCSCGYKGQGKDYSNPHHKRHKRSHLEDDEGQQSTIKKKIKSNLKEDQQQQLNSDNIEYEIGPKLLKRLNEQMEQKQIEINKDLWYDKIDKYSNTKGSKQIIDFLNKQKHIHGYLKNVQEEEVFLFKEQNYKEYKEMLFKIQPPLQLRWSLWKIRMLDTSKFDPKLFDMLIMEEPDQEKQILKDLGRTLPDYQYFQVVNDQSQGQVALYRVLRAVSIFYRDVGYTQGMNFTLGFLLLVSGGNELEAFWTFIELCRHKDYMLLGFYDDQFPMLELVIFIFRKRFKMVLPDLFNHFEQEEITESLWIWQWYLTLFVYSFPIECVARMWDFIMSTNIFGIISLAIAILQEIEKDLLEMDMSDILMYFNSIKENEFNFFDREADDFFDIEKIIQKAKNLLIPADYIRKNTSEYCKKKNLANLYTDYFKNYGKSEKKTKPLVENFSRQKAMSQEQLIEIKEKVVQGGHNKSFSQQNSDEYRVPLDNHIHESELQFKKRQSEQQQQQQQQQQQSLQQQQQQQQQQQNSFQQKQQELSCETFEQKQYFNNSKTHKTTKIQMQEIDPSKDYPNSKEINLNDLQQQQQQQSSKALDFSSQFKEDQYSSSLLDLNKQHSSTSQQDSIQNINFYPKNHSGIQKKSKEKVNATFNIIEENNKNNSNPSNQDLTKKIQSDMIQFSSDDDLEDSNGDEEEEEVKDSSSDSQKLDDDDDEEEEEKNQNQYFNLDQQESPLKKQNIVINQFKSFSNSQLSESNNNNNNIKNDNNIIINNDDQNIITNDNLDFDSPKNTLQITKQRSSYKKRRSAKKQLQQQQQQQEQEQQQISKDLVSQSFQYSKTMKELNSENDCNQYQTKSQLILDQNNIKNNNNINIIQQIQQQQHIPVINDADQMINFTQQTNQQQISNRNNNNTSLQLNNEIYEQNSFRVEGLHMETLNTEYGNDFDNQNNENNHNNIQNNNNNDNLDIKPADSSQENLDKDNNKSIHQSQEYSTGIQQSTFQQEGTEKTNHQFSSNKKEEYNNTIISNEQLIKNIIDVQKKIV